MSGTRVVSTIGFVIIGVFFVGALVIAMLFLVPGASLFGVTAVGRETYVTYAASTNSDVADLLEHRNIIIESREIDVEVRVRKAGQLDEASIQVWEVANGLTFNSVKRTHIDWMQVMVEREDSDGKIVGEVFYKIVIKEPSGAMSRNGYVYINLPSLESIKATDSAGYNFVLNTRRSNVTFASDDIADGSTDNFLSVQSITIGENARGTISFPEPKTDHDFYVDVADFTVNGSNVTVINKAASRGDVKINGNNVKMTLKDVGGDVKIRGNNANLTLGDVKGGIDIEGSTNKASVGEVLGSVALKGNNIDFNQSGNNKTIGGNVRFEGDNGSLRINGCNDLFVRTMNAGVNVAVGCNSIDFEAANNGSLTAHGVSGEGRFGDSAVIKAKNGAVDLRNVWCDVDVNAWEGSAPISVAFSADIEPEGSNLPELKVRAYDGVVTLKNICGEIDVLVRALGKAYVNADFRRVVGDSKIEYSGSTRPPNVAKAGEVNVTFVDDTFMCHLEVHLNAGGRNYASRIEDIPYEDGEGQTYINKVRVSMLRGPIPSGDYVPFEGAGNILENGKVYSVNSWNLPSDSVHNVLIVKTSNALSVHSR